MKTKLLTVGLINLCLTACTNKQLITQSHLVKLPPPVITACERMTVTTCNPKTNGELYECALLISKNLSLCADQADALIDWQKSNQ